ncbi:alpha-glucosidase [Lentilactobacillus sp. G22-6]|uniref:alpha-glucosidase n=1 Tax=Lentilactobacillus dabitei TaxID=2831523 RepID=UPI001C2519B1|nr:alpha-glucosidase [Lentilactobacillus dabitei]
MFSLNQSSSQSPWWQNAVGYQIYPKSFYDSDQDGVGDIQGIIEKTPYIKSLGVNFVWLSPFFASPNVDNGYDVSNYEQIDPQYGKLADVFEMITKFHDEGIKVVFDLVINHTSDQHHWFEEAKKSRNNPYHDFYIWKKPAAGKAPNNWQSLFGGSAWEYNPQTDEYYYHLFAKQQPDLNWENPRVHQAVSEIIDWWASHGVDGFRLDAISHLKKLRTFADVDQPDEAMNDVAGIDNFLQELSDDFKRDHLMTVGEAGGVSVSRARQWVDEQHGYFNMIFQFDHVSFWEKFTVGQVDVAQLRAALTRWQNGLADNGWNALFLENHDLPRAVSYFGNNTDYRKKSAQALGMMYLLMKGTPFVYQGQELGMTNVSFDHIDQFRDLDSKHFYQEKLAADWPVAKIMTSLRAKSRDNARTPIQWSASKFAGFSHTQPWIEVNSNYPEINVADQQPSPQSTLNFYRQLIDLRLTDETLLSGQYHLIDTHDHQLYVYTREVDHSGYLVVTNLSDQPAEFQVPDQFKLTSLVLSNDQAAALDSPIALKPWAANLYMYERKNS